MSKRKSKHQKVYTSVRGNFPNQEVLSIRPESESASVEVFPDVEARVFPDVFPCLESSVDSWSSIIESLERASEAIYRHVDRRLEQRLSVSRLVGVARELRELIKVMAIYAR